MPLKYAAERSVLLKLLLHAAAHPSQSVNGVLIGRVNSKAAAQDTEQSPGSPRVSSQRAAVEILDALPLFHTFLTLAPMTEVALIQADVFARKQGLQLVGYYHANERIGDLELSSAGKKVADRIHSHTAQACVLLVDNSQLQPYLTQKAPTFLQLYTKEGQRGWAQSSPGNLHTADAASVPPLFLEYHGEGRHRELVDFDDHLNDIKKDWLNSPLLT